MYYELKFTEYFLDRCFSCIWEESDTRLYCCIKNKWLKCAADFLFLVDVTGTFFFVFYPSGFVSGYKCRSAKQSSVRCVFCREGLLLWWRWWRHVVGCLTTIWRWLHRDTWTRWPGRNSHLVIQTESVRVTGARTSLHTQFINWFSFD